MPISSTVSANAVIQKPESSFEDMLSAPFPQEINYSDKGYWNAHFAEAIETIKANLLVGMEPQAFSERLFELQGIIGQSLLAPSVYRQGIRDLQKLFKTDANLQNKYGHTLKQLLRTYKRELKAQPEFTLRNLEAELNYLLPLLYERKLDAWMVLQAVGSYRGVVDSTFYHAIHITLKTFIQQFFTIQYDAQGVQVINVLFKARMEQLYDDLGQCFANEERRLALTQPISDMPLNEAYPKNITPVTSVKETFNLSELFKQAFNKLKSATQYVLNNPGKAIIVGLAAQSTMAAALRNERKGNSIISQSSLANQENKSLTHAYASEVITRRKDSMLVEQRPLSKKVAVAKSSKKKHVIPKIEKVVGDEFQVNTYTNKTQEYPTIATMSNGSVFIAWESQDQDGNDYGVYGQIFDIVGNKVGSEIQVNTYINNSQIRSAIAVLNNGNILVVWQSFSQGALDNYDIFGQVIDNAGGKVGNEFQVNTYTTNGQAKPAVTTLNNGNVLVVWESWGQDGSQNGIYGQLVDNTGGKVGNEFQINTYTQNPQQQPAVTALSNGNALIVWESDVQDGSNYGIFGQILSSAGSKVGGEFQINTHTLNHQYRAKVATLSNGNVLVTWMSLGQDDSGHGIFAQIINSSGNKIGAEFQVNTHTLGDQSYPAVTVLNNGYALITWQSDLQDGSNNGIFGQVINNVGKKIGVEFQINTYTSGDQRDPAAAKLNNGNMLVTWSSNMQDGDGYGIYGKIINTYLTVTNANQTLDYQENTPQNLGSIVIEPPIFITNVTATLTLSDPVVGSLTNDTSGNVTSSYDTNTGAWQASGNVTDVNALLASVQFQPAPNFKGNFTIGITVDDRFNLPFNATIAAIGHPNPALTTTRPARSSHSSNDNTTPIIIGAAAGGGLLLTGLLTAAGLFAYRRRKNQAASQTPAVNAEIKTELGQSAVELPTSPIDKSAEPNQFKPSIVKRKAKGHTTINDKYELINKINQEEARALEEQTGILVSFDPGKKKTRYRLGQGQFGQLKLALDVASREFVGVKKIKTAKKIAESKDEANMLYQLQGLPRVIPFYDGFEGEDSQEQPVLYHFMKLAGFGNGEVLQEGLKRLNDETLQVKLMLYTAENLLLALQEIHGRHIYHLDLKPSNFVFDSQGNLYLIDFGCAKFSTDGQIRQLANGDTRYFSAERLKATYDQTPFDGEKTDLWAVGVMLLEIMTGQYPFGQTSVKFKRDNWNEKYFHDKLAQIESFNQAYLTPILNLIKNLLLTPNQLLTVKQALAMPIFQQPEQRFQSDEERTMAFAKMRRLLLGHSFVRPEKVGLNKSERPEYAAKAIYEHTPSTIDHKYQGEKEKSLSNFMPANDQSLDASQENIALPSNNRF